MQQRSAALTKGAGVSSARIEDLYAGSRVVFPELRFKAVGVVHSNVWQGIDFAGSKQATPSTR